MKNSLLPTFNGYWRPIKAKPLPNSNSSFVICCTNSPSSSNSFNFPILGTKSKTYGSFMISSACSPKGCNNRSLKFVVFTANTCLEYKLLSNSYAKTVLDQPFSMHCVVYQICSSSVSALSINNFIAFQLIFAPTWCKISSFEIRFANYFI